MEEDVEFRRGLPLDYLTYMGVQNSDKVIISYFVFFVTSVTLTIIGVSLMTQVVLMHACVNVG